MIPRIFISLVCILFLVLCNTTHSGLTSGHGLGASEYLPAVDLVASGKTQHDYDCDLLDCRRIASLRQATASQQAQDMITYANKGGDSGVESYMIGADYIVVKFKSKTLSGYDTYRYDLRRIGERNLEEMKRLAMEGEGLNEFINRNPRVRNGYTSRQ